MVLLAKASRGKDVTLNESDLASMFGLAVEAYSPLGGGDLVQMVTPTLFDPLVDVSRNISYSGRPIEPEYKHGVERKYVPTKERFYDDLENTWLGRASINASSFVDDANIADVSPAVLNYLINGYLGGVAKFSSQLAGATESALSGNKLHPSDTPIASRFYSEISEDDRNRLIEKRSQRGVLGEIKDFATKQRQEDYYRFKEADAEFKRINALPLKEQAKRLRATRLANPEVAEIVVNKLKRAEKQANKTLEGLAISKLSRDTRLAYISSKLSEFESSAEREVYVDKLIDMGAIS